MAGNEIINISLWITDCGLYFSTGSLHIKGAVVLETIIVIISIAVFGIPIFMNTVGPFIIWRTQKLPAIVKFESIDSGEFLQNRNQLFLGYNHSLIDLGFTTIGSSLLKDSHTDSYFRLYWHNDLKLAAMVVTMKSNVEDMTYLEFTQKYSDGTVLDVSNSPRAEAYPKLDIKLAYRYPGVCGVEPLLKIHNTLMDKFKGNVEPVEYDVHSGFREVELFLKEESDALLAKGIVSKLIDSDGKRSLTLLGAVALTYRSVPPGKNIWGYITEKRAERALRNV